MATGDGDGDVAARRLRRMFAFLLVLSISLLAAATAAQAHLIETDGRWTVGYYTRSNDSNAVWACANSVERLDPLNIITFQYGEASSMFDHINGETDWYNVSIGSDQVICTWNGASWGTQGDHDQAIGHGPEGTNQAHYRLFPAGHLHPDLVDKFSVADFHHEDGIPHQPDESWEEWEEHVANEIRSNHNVYADYYWRATHDSWRGFADNGYVTRIGGLHYD